MANISIKDLSFSFPSHQIFKNFSLDIEDGSILGLIGPSGCGKTTLARAIAGLLTPDEGEIYIGEQCVFSKTKRINIAPERRNIGMVFQDYAVWPHKSVYKNIEYPLQRKKVNKLERPKLVERALEQVRMSDYKEHMPVQLSGGQQQRVAIARALVSSNSFMIMDEPITNLDAKLREEMIDEIRNIQRHSGTTIIYITHDQETALKLCDKIAVMDKNANIIQIGKDEEIILEPKDRFVFEFIGVSNFLPIRLNNGEISILDKKGTRAELFSTLNEYKHSNRVNINLEENKEYELAFRPLDVKFDNASNLKATVESKTFLGSHYVYFVNYLGHSIRVQQSTLDSMDKKLPEEGEKVGIVITASNIYEKKERTENEQE